MDFQPNERDTLRLIASGQPVSPVAWLALADAIGGAPDDLSPSFEDADMRKLADFLLEDGEMSEPQRGGLRRSCASGPNAEFGSEGGVTSVGSRPCPKA